MEWPREGVMLTLFGLYDGERLTIMGRELWLSCGTVRDAYLVPLYVTDELIRRKWVMFSNDSWDGVMLPTQSGLYWLERWLPIKYPKMKGMNLPTIRKNFQMRDAARVVVVV